MDVVEQWEVYPNAPLVLVALEVRHPATAPLTPAQQHAIKRRLQDHVPIMRAGQLQELTLVQAGRADSAASELRTERFPRYFSRDSTASVSMRAEAMVVETTRYAQWEQLRALVTDALEVRKQVGEVDGVERVGLRYVNEIRVPGVREHGWAPWVDSTLLGPVIIGDNVGLEASQWQGVSIFAQRHDRQVVLRHGAREGFAVNPGGDLKRSTPPPGPFFLIDIDSFWTPSEVPKFDADVLLTACDELHAPVRRLFERLITERLREEVLRFAE